MKFSFKELLTLKRWKLWVGIIVCISGGSIYEDNSYPWGMKMYENPGMMFFGMLILQLGFLLTIVDFNSFRKEKDDKKGFTFNFNLKEKIGLSFLILSISLLGSYSPIEKQGIGYIHIHDGGETFFYLGIVLFMLGGWLIYQGSWFKNNLLKYFKKGKKENVG